MRRKLWSACRSKLWAVLLCLVIPAVAICAPESTEAPVTFDAEGHRLVLDQAALNLTVGEDGNASLTAALTPDLSEQADIVFHWSSLDPEVAMVSDAGASATVTALRGGVTRLAVKATISAWEAEWSAECEVRVHEPVQSINFSTGLLMLRVRDPERGAAKLAYAVYPPTHTETVAWRVEQDSEGDAVIAFDAESGLVQALRGGTAYVVAESSDGTSARCKVEVEAAESDLPQSSSGVAGVEDGLARLPAGEEGGLAQPEQAMDFAGRDAAIGIRLGENPVVLKGSLVFAGAVPPDDELVWRSSDKQVARVDEQGVVYPVKTGKATITVRSSSGEEASSVVTVYKRDALSVRLHTKSPARLTVGKTLRPAVTFSPSHSYAELYWSSSDAAVATVDPGSGLVTARGKGTARITAEALNGSLKNISFTVEVNAPITSLSMYADAQRDDAAWQALPGQTRALEVTPEPAWGITSDTVTWTSKNKRVASVDKHTGVVTAHREGEAVITARASSGVKATCRVRVENPAGNGE